MLGGGKEQALRGKCTHVLLSAKGTALRYSTRQPVEHALAAGPACFTTHSLIVSTMGVATWRCNLIEHPIEAGARTHRWGRKMIVGNSDSRLSWQPVLWPGTKGSEGLSARLFHNWVHWRNVGAVVSIDAK